MLWPLNEFTFVVLDDFVWPKVHDPEWEAPEAEYEGQNANPSVSEREDILLVSDSDKINRLFCADDESIASYMPNTVIKNN